MHIKNAVNIDLRYKRDVAVLESDSLTEWCGTSVGLDV